MEIKTRKPELKLNQENRKGIETNMLLKGLLRLLSPPQYLAE